MLSTAIRTIAASQVDLVSFDVFDTLLERRCSADRVARDAAERLVVALSLPGDDRAIVELVIAHRRAWTRVREAPYPRSEVEWSISRWLADLAGALGVDPEPLVAAGRSAELEAEKAGTAPRAEGIVLLREARRWGKRVVALSDTTLDGELLRELLAFHGIELDEVFASCDLGASKRRGTAYREVVARTGAARPVHIGDNLKVDFVRATEASVTGLWLPRLAPGSQAHELVSAALEMAEVDHPDVVVRTVAQLVAPVVLAMCVARARFSTDLGSDRTLYLARDAWLLARVDRRSGLSGAKDSYVRLSRRAVALLHPDDLLARISLSGKVGKRSLRAFVGGFDLPESLEHALLRATNVDPDARLDEGARAAWQHACAAHREAIDTLRDERRALLRELLAPHVAGARRATVVDLGWAGTIQDCIGAALDGIEVHGFYLGLTRGGCEPRPGARKRGFLFDDFVAHRSAPPLGRTAGVIRLWELLLREPAPTALGLRRANDGTPFVELGSTDVIDAGASNLARRVREGIDLACDGVAHRLEVLASTTSEALDHALRRVAARRFVRLSTAPPPEFARELLEVAMDEGATRGLVTTLGRGGVAAGVTWWPGLLAAYLSRGAGRSSNAR